MSLSIPKYLLRSTVTLATVAFVTSGVAMGVAIKLSMDLSRSLMAEELAWTSHGVSAPREAASGMGSGSVRGMPFVGELKGVR